MNLPRGEVNLVHLVEHVAQQIPAHHAVDGALKNLGDHVAPVAVRALQAAQIGEQARPACSVRACGLVLVDESEKLGPCDALSPSRPIPPAVGQLNAGRNRLPSSLTSSSRTLSMSPRNFKNKIQVSMGKRLAFGF